MGALSFASFISMASAEPAPWSVETAVHHLNAMYMDFDASDDNTALGVTMGFAGDTDSFDDNLFCQEYTGTGCWRGHNDCRMPAAMINHKVMVQTQGSGYKVQPPMNRAVGYVFNQTLTENYFGKCIYLYDGADSLNVNRGCGASAPLPASCDNQQSAYYNMCTNDGGATYHHCVAADPEIVGKKCKCESCSPTYGTITPPRNQQDETCFYEMPALIVPEDDSSSFTPSSTNHVRDAMKQRVLSDESGGGQAEWNEVVIDESLLIPSIHSDPARTVIAFVYLTGAGMDRETAETLATMMRDGFKQTYGGFEVPVIEMDTVHDFTLSGGPFKNPATTPTTPPPPVAV